MLMNMTLMTMMKVAVMMMMMMMTTIWMRLLCLWWLDLIHTFVFCNHPPAVQTGRLQTVVQLDIVRCTQILWTSNESKHLTNFYSSIWVFPKIVVGPQNGWFIMENPIKMDDLEISWDTIIFGNTHMYHGYHLDTSSYASSSISASSYTSQPQKNNLQVNFWGETVCLALLWDTATVSKIRVDQYIMSIWLYMGVSKNNGTPKSSILIGFSLINHPFWGTPHQYMQGFFQQSLCI